MIKPNNIKIEDLLYDITMCVKRGVEVCKFVGLYNPNDMKINTIKQI